MLKTRSGVKKRVKVTWTGKIMVSKAGKKHLLMNKSKKSKGRHKYGLVIAAAEVSRIKRQIPYSI